MRKTVIIVVALLFVARLNASAQDYMVQGATPNLYLAHKVEAKETWYSIGRQYSLPPKEIAAYNGQSLDKALEIGQALKVPLTNSNFSQEDSKSGQPVYHIIAEKEWMYRISVNHNKVPLERLEKWNNIKRDEAKAGMKLIVGYLKTNAVAKQDKPAESKKALGENSVADKKTAEVKPQATSGETQETNGSTKPASSTSSSTTGSAKSPSSSTPPAVNMPKQSGNNSPKNGGYFRSLYAEVGTSSSGVAGIFKSTSGWNDGKYYVLMSNVVIGTIVKITYPQTGKIVYAKVLGELPDMKESAGLALRISDAAASELGATASKFSVDVKY